MTLGQIKLGRRVGWLRSTMLIALLSDPWHESRRRGTAGFVSDIPQRRFEEHLGQYLCGTNEFVEGGNVPQPLRFVLIRTGLVGLSLRRRSRIL